jgi:cobyrinic acid a,c-diamide synthase
MKSQFLIAAPHSGAGKTTVTLGLLRALRRKGHRVQPFKCGPDFIDPIHHQAAAGRDSVNLDRYMMSDVHIRDLYDRYGADADVCITEGVMGLFDGSVKSKGSSADLAKLMGLPVILVLNAKAMAYSAAAILYGLKNFDPALRIAGVLFNFVDTEGHYRLLQEACADVGVDALGYLPANAGLRIPSRHLGLDTAEAENAIEAAADHIEKHIRLEELLAVTQVKEGPDRRNGKPMTSSSAPGYRTVLIAKDAAFHFLYPENIRRLEQWGRIHYFSPLTATRLPVKPDLLYLPGGYPELYLAGLAGNGPLLEQLRGYAAAGGRIIAECGGMMYLGHSIIDEKGVDYTMAGILDTTTSMQQKRLSLGYRTVLLPGGAAKGHEFHYSRFEGQNAMDRREGYNSRGDRMDIPFVYTSRILASYLHLYWGEETGFLESWLNENAWQRAVNSQK